MTENKESEQLQDFLTELLNSLKIDAEVASPFQEHNFIETIKINCRKTYKKFNSLFS